MTHRPRIAAVAIGRNEGERLRVCLRSLLGGADRVLYVDSNSTDASVALAESLGVEVIRLDPAGPLSAARARNAGFEHLEQGVEQGVEQGEDPPELIQFVDGDCELDPGWLNRAAEALAGDPNTAVVCGRLRELHPEQSPYNRLCDMEFAGHPGEVPFCGGIFMIRAEAYRAVGGMDADIPVGEEPELCIRLRRRGWTIRRIDAEMGRHDAAMLRFGQWWRRSVRNGYGFADGAARHGHTPQRHWVRESRSITFWGLLYPLALLALAWPTRGLSLLGLAAYPAMALKIARGRRKAFGDRWAHAILYGGFIMLGKFAEAIGQVRCWCHRILAPSSERRTASEEAPAQQKAGG